MNRDAQEAKELMQVLISRARARKIKEYEDRMARGMMTFIKESGIC